ncbi:hypothetical protein [Acanthopleuribacter pedis]|uniref:Uncharacterized protein n=1 Tax=Acanthopleuribacter pedis TaxID=442870 RepID=A0A8J7QJ17_9BACT|nr:hypothetical protein [Acanthopleuribacter pedis]MBO1319120.1 hypothetical protein [Acanthopleuribacter pedis]
MTQPLHQAVKQFETTYPPQLKRWALHMEAEELERVTEFLAAAQKESERISALLRKADEPRLQARWQSVLKLTLSLCDPVARRLDQIQKEADVARRILHKGQVGLTGYRQNLGNKRLFLDSQA